MPSAKNIRKIPPPVLVTGAGGCIGAWVLKQLTEDGINAVAFDLSDNRRRLSLVAGDEIASAMPWEIGDIADGIRLRKIADDYGINSVIHLAALQVPFCKADPAAGAKANVLGTINVFELARSQKIKNLSYASSVAATAQAENSPWLRTLYGAFKVCGEQIAQVYWRDWQTPSVGIRPSVVYGPARDQGMSASPTIAMLAAAANVNYEIPFRGKVGFVYAAEAASAFIAAAANAGKTPLAGEGAPIFDLNGIAESVENVIEIIRANAPNANITCKGEPLPFPSDMSDLPLRNFVGDYPRLTLEKGISETMDFFRRQIADGRLSAADVK